MKPYPSLYSQKFSVTSSPEDESELPPPASLLQAAAIIDSATTATNVRRQLIGASLRSDRRGPADRFTPGARAARPSPLVPSCPRHGHDRMITFPGLAGKPSAFGRRPGVRSDARARVGALSAAVPVVPGLVEVLLH